MFLVIFYLPTSKVFKIDHMSSTSPGKVWSLLLYFVLDLLQFSIDEKGDVFAGR